MKRILVDAFQKEEVRIAITEKNQLENLEILKVTGSEKRGNIYKGVVSRIEKHLEAAFIDYGMERHGFLALKNIADEFKENATANNNNTVSTVTEKNQPSDDSDDEKNQRTRKKSRTSGNVSIVDCLKVGQEIIVQVEKEERGSKGAALTTIINLASTYIVLTPNDSKVSGVSKSIPYGSRSSLKQALSEIVIPEKMGLIVRTIGAKKNAKDIQWCLDYLCSLWRAIQKYADEKKAPFLIYQESPVIKTMRDHMREDVNEVIINDQESFEEIKQYADGVIPDFSEKISLYDGMRPIFSQYGIEKQAQTAFNREVSLSSGGSIIIDFTEALVSIDVNSSKSNKGANIEETAINTNIEAAIEVARQIKLRDVGGLIVIDFIDMKSEENRQKVIKTFNDHTKNDRALIKIGGISNFGLLEISRQRLRSSLNDSNQMQCPQCGGSGSIQTVEAMSVRMIRHLQEMLESKKYQKIILYVPSIISIYMLNEKRFEIARLESHYQTDLVIVPNPNYQIPQFTTETIDDSKKLNQNKTSFNVVKSSDHHYETLKEVREKPSLISPIDAPQRKKSIFERLGFGKVTQVKEEKPLAKRKPRSRNYKSRKKATNS